MDFNFKGLHRVFLEAVNRHEPSIAFTLSEGRGRFIFLLFLKTDSAGSVKWKDLELFILLACTRKMLKFRLYGNHKYAGDFRIFPSKADEKAIREELGLRQVAEGPGFNLLDFLGKLDAMIPDTISLEKKVTLINSIKPEIVAHCGDYIDDASKVYPVGIICLPSNKHPREETLRKLYMLNTAKPAVIADLIRNLKAINYTISWTAIKPETDKFDAIFAKAARASQRKPEGVRVGLPR
jgi:hypothetical protein